MKTKHECYAERLRPAASIMLEMRSKRKEESCDLLGHKIIPKLHPPYCSRCQQFIEEKKA